MDGEMLLSKTDIAVLFGENAMEWYDDNLVGGKWKDLRVVLNNVLTAAVRFDDLPKTSDSNALLNYVSNKQENDLSLIADALYDMLDLFPSTRGFLEKTLNDLDVSSMDMTGTVKFSVTNVKGALTQELFPNPWFINKTQGYTVWRKQFTSLIKIAKSALELQKASSDMGSILDNLLDPSGGLMDLLDNQEVANEIGKLIEEQIGNVAENAGIGIALPQDGGNYDADAIKEIAGIMGDVVGTISAPNVTAEQIADNLADALIGGDKENPDFSKLESIAESGVEITLDNEKYEAVKGILGTKPTDSNPNQYGLTSEQWEKLDDMFKQKQ
jgi:hypothetical protein